MYRLAIFTAAIYSAEARSLRNQLYSNVQPMTDAVVKTDTAFRAEDAATPCPKSTDPAKNSKFG